MTFLPIVERELRVAARRRATYWTRVGAGLLGVCVLAWIMTFSFRQTAPQLGQAVFLSLSGLAFLYCLMIGVRNTADCISEEKREGTLGLLFLTDLKGYDVVFGKLVATSLNSFYGLLALFPIMAIPLLLGGMTLAQLGRMVLLLTNTMFFSLAVGLWVSTMSHSERRAASLTFALILFFAAGLPLIGYILQEFYYHDLLSLTGLDVSREGFVIPFLLPSPGYAMGRLFESSWRSTVHSTVWWSLLTTHVMAWGFIGFASARLPRVWQDKAQSAAAVRWRDRWKQWCYGNGGQRRAFRHQLMNVNPFYWLAGRDRLKPMYVWAFLGLVAAGWLWGYFEERRDWLDQGWCIATALLLHTVLRVWLAGEACQRFGEDRQSGALELILATPLKVTDILRGQILALQRQFLWPVIVVLTVDFLFLLTDPRDKDWVWLCVGAMAMLLADLYAICWLGMWLGLKSRHASRASGSVIARILVLPWLIFFLLVTAFELLRLVSRGFRLDDDYFGAIWFVLGILVDVVFTVWATTRLHRDFRTVATQRVEGAESQASWWPFKSSHGSKPLPPVLR